MRRIPVKYYLFFKYVLLLVLFSFEGLFAQATDSISLDGIKKELQLVKALREKDSLKIELLTQELKRQLFLEESLSEKKDSKADSLFLKQKEEIEKLREKINGTPVVFYGDTLFSIYTSLGPYDAKMRARNLEDKLSSLYKRPFFFSDSLVVKHSSGFLNITYQDEIISGVTAIDAIWANTSPEELAHRQAKILKESVVKHRKQNSLKNNLLRIFELFVIILISVLIVWLINKLFRYVRSLLLTSKNRFLNGIKIRNYEILKKGHIQNVLSKILSALEFLILVIILVTVIPMAFNIFPSTQNWSEVFREWTWEPVKSIWHSILNYFPKLIKIVIILFIVHFVLRMMRFFALEVERGSLTLKNFHPEWARTTYSLARFILLMLALVLIFPYLPGSNSVAFKGVSVFLGILISIGSSSAVANAVAGLVITYMRSFQTGDWIKTGDVIGVVIEKNALVTRLRTINNEDVSVPNSAVLSGATINYSSLGKTQGLVITVKVKVRYEYSHNLIEELLITAANRTKDIAEKPYAYVFQISLEEINAVYELNAFTFVPENMYFIKSDLIRNIQNVFREAKVEIFSTQYVEIRNRGESVK